MVLSRRERYVGIAAAVVLAILALDRLVVEPLLTRKAELDSRIASARLNLQRAERLFANSQRMSQTWNEMLRGGLTKEGAEAESQVMHSVRDWAQDAGMNLLSVKPERTEKEKDFVRITFRATGSGGMSEIGRFLWRIQTAVIPVRIIDLVITSRKDGTDDLTMTVSIATSHLAPSPASDRPAAASIREFQP